MSTQSGIKKEVSRILYGRTPSATLVNHVLVALNVAVIALAIVSLVTAVPPVVQHVMFVCGIFFALEYAARFWISRHKWRFVFRLVNILDIVVVVSLLAIPFAHSFGFLRALRLLQLLRAYRLFAHRFDEHNDFIYRNIEIATAAAHIIVFLLVMSGIVYATQVEHNAAIASYVDALYFTMATATTTGFGDIILTGTMGKTLSIIIMFFGVTLFFQLVKTTFSPRWLYTVCPGCSHPRHLRDAHYCMRCGHKLKNKHYLSQQTQRNDF